MLADRNKVEEGDDTTEANSLRNFLIDKLGGPESWKQTVADEKNYLKNLPMEMGMGGMGSIAKIGKGTGGVFGKIKQSFSPVKVIDTEVKGLGNTLNTGKYNLTTPQALEAVYDARKGLARKETATELEHRSKFLEDPVKPKEQVAELYEKVKEVVDTNPTVEVAKSALRRKIEAAKEIGEKTEPGVKMSAEELIKSVKGK